jgi:hypothetical protein
MLDNKTALLTDTGNDKPTASAFNRKLIYGTILLSSVAFVLGCVGAAKSTTTGPKGADGLQGERGRQGDQGAPGTSGTNGINGINGKDATYFQDSYTIPALNFVPENFNFDTFSQRFIFGSIAKKGIFTADFGSVSKGQASISSFWRNDGKIVDAGILGVYVDSTSNLAKLTNDYNVWGAIAYFKEDNKNIGVVRYNPITGASQVFDLTDVSKADLNIVNDLVVVPDGSVYVTNMFNGQILKIPYDQANKNYLAPELFVNNSNAVAPVQWGSSFGFDGIEFTDGYILAGVFAPPGANKGGLYRISLLNPNAAELVQVNGATLQYVDGVRFNADRSRLYVCVGGQYLFVLSSTDQWQTAKVEKQLDLKSVVTTLTAVTLVPNPDTGDVMVYVLDSNGFGAGPYFIKRVTL